MGQSEFGGLVVPDLAEPILAYRTWDIRDLRLWSINVRGEWEAGPMRAKCDDWSKDDDDEFVDEDHDAVPDMECTCGFYSFKDREHQEAAYYTGDINGEVLIWGNVIEGTKGWRSEYAQVVTLYRDKHCVWTNSLPYLEEFYGCKVVDAPKIDEELMHKRAQENHPKPSVRPGISNNYTSMFQSLAAKAMQSIEDNISMSLYGPESTTIPVFTANNVPAVNAVLLGPGGTPKDYDLTRIPPGCTLDTRTNLISDEDGFTTTDGYKWRKTYG